MVYPIANCGLPCCKSIDFLSGQEVLQHGPHRTGGQYSLFYVAHPSGFRPLALPEPADGTAGNGSGVGDRTTDIPAGCDRGDRGRRSRFLWRPSAIEVLGPAPGCVFFHTGALRRFPVLDVAVDGAAADLPSAYRQPALSCSLRLAAPDPVLALAIGVGRLPLKSRSGPFSGGFGY